MMSKWSSHENASKHTIEVCMFWCFYVMAWWALMEWSVDVVLWDFVFFVMLIWLRKLVFIVGRLVWFHMTGMCVDYFYNIGRIGHIGQQIRIFFIGHKPTRFLYVILTVQEPLDCNLMGRKKNNFYQKDWILGTKCPFWYPINSNIWNCVTQITCNSNY